MLLVIIVIVIIIIIIITFFKVEIVNLVYVVLEGHYKWYQSWVSFSRVYGFAYIISCIILFVVNIF
jgi:hypothetical protein